MRLLLELCQEHGLAAIVNIHDVVLAREFLPRIVGLRAGQVVFDGRAGNVSSEVLTSIYGDEDWTAIARRMRQHEAGHVPEESDLIAEAK